MKFLARFESKLGLTRGDVTVALFLAGTALGGFLYATVFDPHQPDKTRHEMLALAARHDSIADARRNAATAHLETQLATDVSDTSTAGDSIPAWQPLDDKDAARDAAQESIDRSAKGGSSSSKKSAPSAPIDINKEPKEGLMRLPGVGEKTAEAIVEHRRHTPFRSPEDIMEGKGIGEKKFQKMKEFVRVR
jgi:competence ComEA-like helix-hairpin-helix protein